jgi:flagellar motility protein MotE (MotC chaperone)
MAREAKAKQDEAKRISRLARLYGEMKADEAVPIINQLDDSTVLAIFGKMEDGQVAKILAQLDARRAARLTQNMLKGKTM